MCEEKLTIAPNEYITELPPRLTPVKWVTVNALNELIAERDRLRSELSAARAQVEKLKDLAQAVIDEGSPWDAEYGNCDYCSTLTKTHKNHCAWRSLEAALDALEKEVPYASSQIKGD